ncbi:MAG: hypothetical protein AB1758_37965, partial [Candidatus Eremiobacterota bacterium]
LAAATPAKFHAMEELHRPGLGEAWAERPAVREAGRELGRAIESVPYLRQALELAGGLVAPVQVRRGARRLEDGFLCGDERQKFHGKMSLASGLMMLGPVGPVAALAAAAAHGVVGTMVDRQVMSLEQANRVGNVALAVSLGPLGMVGSAVGEQLEAAGVDIQRVAYAPGEHPTGKPDAENLGGLPWLVGGASLGMCLGASLGALVGGVAGGVTGMFWGPFAGAVLGLGAYSLVRPDPQPSQLDLTSEDKRFLARVIGGGVLGGAAGSLLGGHAGQLTGAAAGGALLGPPGAVTGAWFGRALGMLAGSLALGRAGAWAGRRWAESAEP